MVPSGTTTARMMVFLGLPVPACLPAIRISINDGCSAVRHISQCPQLDANATRGEVRVTGSPFAEEQRGELRHTCTDTERFGSGSRQQLRPLMLFCRIIGRGRGGLTGNGQKVKSQHIQSSHTHRLFPQRASATTARGPAAVELQLKAARRAPGRSRCTPGSAGSSCRPARRLPDSPRSTAAAAPRPAGNGRSPPP